MAISTKWKVDEKEGFAPQLREYLRLYNKALSGDFALAFTHTTAGKTAQTSATATWSQKTTLTLKTAAGEVHEWFNGPLRCALTDSSPTGVFSISGGVATTIWFASGTTAIPLTSTTGPFRTGTTAVLAVGSGANKLLGWPVTTVKFTVTFA